VKGVAAYCPQEEKPIDQCKSCGVIITEQKALARDRNGIRTSQNENDFASHGDLQPRGGVHGVDSVGLSNPLSSSREDASRDRWSAETRASATSWEVRPGVRRQVRLLVTFATGSSNDNMENPRPRKSTPSLQHPANATENVISHDRWFLDRTATYILAFEGDSVVTWFEGNDQDYEKDRKKRMGADQPHRIKYRKIDA
jgi:hypothetical protein